MNEINKSEIKFNPSVRRSAKHDVKPEREQISADREYKEEASAPGAEAAGRAQIMIGKAKKPDNIESDIELLLNNPEIADVSDAMFVAAERAGIPYPEAAVFATQEVL